jgi:hypothetical protein
MALGTWPIIYGTAPHLETRGEQKALFSGRFLPIQIPNVLVQGLLIGVYRSGVQLAGPLDHDTYQPNRRAKGGARDGVHLQLAGSKLTGMRLLTNFLDG